MENTIKKFVAIAYLLIGSGTLVAQNKIKMKIPFIIN